MTHKKAKRSQAVPAPAGPAEARLQVLVTRRGGKWLVHGAHVTLGQEHPSLIGGPGLGRELVVLVDVVTGTSPTDALLKMDRRLRGLKRHEPGRFRLLKAASRFKFADAFPQRGR